MKDEKKRKAVGGRRRAAFCIPLSVFSILLFFISKNIHFISEEVEGIG
jgi:hypothetical protein